jgi:transcriptional regulator with XRE-family HTH domain
MAKPYRTLREKMSPDAQRRAAEKADAMIRDMALDELRSARDLTQQQLAKLLGVEQAAVSKMERRTDMYISTLQTAIKAMGGDLEIRAIFPDGVVRIDQFRDIERSRRRPLKVRSA